jgi:hypothetical protein
MDPMFQPFIHPNGQGAYYENYVGK